MKKSFLSFKKMLLVTFLLLSGMSQIFAQTCTMTLNPTQDAYVWSLTNPNQAATNFGSATHLSTGRWTWSSVAGVYRTFIRFNTPTLPAGAVMTGATLNLNGSAALSFAQAGHATAGTGSTASTLQAVSANWAEGGITWNNQPGVVGPTVAIPAHINNAQSYNLNVLNMVQNMIANPANNFGFRIINNTEASYSQLIFGSRENANPALRPSLTITYTLPALLAPTFVTTPQSQVCVGATSNFNVNAVLNATRYTWLIDGVVAGTGANPNFSRTWTAADFGPHVIRVRADHNNNCIVSPDLVFNIFVNSAPAAPFFITTPQSQVCAGATSNLTVNTIANATSFSWSIDGTVVNTSTSPNFSKTWAANEVGAHVIRVRGINNCGNGTELVFNITVLANPTVQPITGNSTVCVNQYIPLSNSTVGGVWSSSNPAIATVNNFGLVQGISAGTVQINYTITNGSGCSSVASTTVTVNGTLVFQIVGPSILCPNTSGNAYTVSPAVPGADYTWNIQDAPEVGVNFPVNGSTNTSLSIPNSQANNTFTLRCQGLNACGASTIVTKSISISNDVPPVPNITCSGTSGSNTCVDLVVTNNAGYTIEWIVNGVVVSNAPVFNRPLSTTVMCTFTSPTSGCKKSAWYSPAVVCTYAARVAEEVGTAAIEVPSNLPFAIYPNPSKGVFKIDTKGQSGVATISNSIGQTVKIVTLSDSQTSYTVELAESGMYTIMISSQEGNKAYKIVVE